MGKITLPDELLEQLQAIASEENRSPAAVLKTLLDGYKTSDTLRNARLKTYEDARRYWLSNSDTARLMLTDQELDEQFWLIDEKGIPRLKSDQKQITLAVDPLEQILGVFDDDVSDLSMTVRETLRKGFEDKYERSD